MRRASRAAESYREMEDRILDAVRGGFRTCAAFYGHAGVFAQPSHGAVRGPAARDSARACCRGCRRRTACSPTSG